jgi:hypothetical protein
VAKARGVVLGRQEGQRPSDKKAEQVMALHRWVRWPNALCRLSNSKTDLYRRGSEHPSCSPIHR